MIDARENEPACQAMAKGHPIIGTVPEQDLWHVGQGTQDHDEYEEAHIKPLEKLLAG